MKNIKNEEILINDWNTALALFFYKLKKDALAQDRKDTFENVFKLFNVEDIENFARKYLNNDIVNALLDGSFKDHSLYCDTEQYMFDGSDSQLANILKQFTSPSMLENFVFTVAQSGAFEYQYDVKMFEIQYQKSVMSDKTFFDKVKSLFGIKDKPKNISYINSEVAKFLVLD